MIVLTENRTHGATCVTAEMTMQVAIAAANATLGIGTVAGDAAIKSATIAFYRSINIQVTATQQLHASLNSHPKTHPTPHAPVESITPARKIED